MSKCEKWKMFILLFSFATICGFAGCTTMPKPEEVECPEPIHDNSGKYMCPYTSDGVLAEWTDRAIGAQFGTAIGKGLGAYAGQRALQQVPFVGGILGGIIGAKIGREIAVSAAGGWDKIREESDLSFNDPGKLAAYIYSRYSGTEHYQHACKVTFAIYPSVQKAYISGIQKAAKKA